MSSKTKYILIEAIIIITHLTSMIQGFILITERDAVESLLKQIKTSKHGDKKDDRSFENYLHKYNPREFKRELINTLLSEESEYKHKERPVSRNRFRIHKTKPVYVIHNIEDSLSDFFNKIKLHTKVNRQVENKHAFPYNFKDEPIDVSVDRIYRFDEGLLIPIKIGSKNLLKKVKQRSVRKMFTKSGEVHDHLAPGAFTVVNIHEEPKQKTPKRLPEYPFWNYWTYNKQIYRDKCPMNTVQNDGICIRVQPH